MDAATPTAPKTKPLMRLAALLDNDIAHSFWSSKVTVVAAVVMLTIVLAALFAPWIAPHDPFDLKSLQLLDSHLPPSWQEGGDPRFLLGTDDQGRDVFSTILYGSRLSLAVGVMSVAFAATLGIVLGLIAGYAGGALDSLIMRAADVQLTFPAILIALLVDGTVRGLFGERRDDQAVLWVLVLSIGLSFWVQYARTVRGLTFVEKHKDYVLAARLIGIHPAKILLRHVLPNVMGPVLVIITINLALAVILEATLSFLGVGLPPTQPSLGTMIRIGNNFLFSGEWWIVMFPGFTLVALVLAVNLVGDWLRDALNPKLR
jgi:peptide/nickel transport system permease protein